MKIKRETIKKLDRFNLHNALEECSLGNVVRGCLWASDFIRNAVEVVKKVTQERKKSS